ncbi:MAG: class II D-tagatose-bisphosphate aldolase, non-catalytic subunit [Spirochaetaceae bacterium]|nr:class II D-tagatose-bisphosphate aldolase, non-catalytic subunit [Spirochaetaceae bacterium]
MTAVETFIDIIKANKAGSPRGIYSVCSAHEGVIRASMKQALEDDSILLVESTSNQVDQFGGYTGMKPADFVEYLNRVAGDTGFPVDRLLLGGDHLGPNSWQNLNAREAMENSHELIKQYVSAGYQKIHLDASMFLSDDQGDRTKPLADEIVAWRSAALCSTAEKAWKALDNGSPAPVYIIGTEVPIPGGAKEQEEGLEITPASDARQTVEITRNAFLKEGLSAAWERVCGLVVQPGVEFGDDQVFDFDTENATQLSHALDDIPNLVFEAHSTDYQTPSALSSMTEKHFCIQKVGPWLTFAWREALFALASIEDELIEEGKTSGLKQILEKVMLENSKYWLKYYPGSEREQLIKRKYSYSDRSRYYWPENSLISAVNQLFTNLRNHVLPATLLSQFMPNQYHAWRQGVLDLDPQNLAEFHVREVLKVYSAACRF